LININKRKKGKKRKKEEKRRRDEKKPKNRNHHRNAHQTSPLQAQVSNLSLIQEQDDQYPPPSDNALPLQDLPQTLNQKN
jgi:hypothetical protein